MYHGNCKWGEALLALIVLVFTIWPTQILSATMSWWLVVIAAALILIHSLFCKKCGGLCCMGKMSNMDMKPKRKRR